MLEPQADSPPFSKSRLNRLGERLRKVEPTKEDLETLTAFRGSFHAAAFTVQEMLQQAVKGTLEDESSIAARPAKRCYAIISKLKRDKGRLAEMQDIAGCRIAFTTAADQERFYEERLCSSCNNLGIQIERVDDRRRMPKFGYRAIHVIAAYHEHRVEIQMRTNLQHLWANISESCGRLFGADVKYGGGSPLVRGALEELSASIGSIEDEERLYEEGLRTGDEVFASRQLMQSHMSEQLRLLLRAAQAVHPRWTDRQAGPEPELPVTHGCPPHQCPSIDRKRAFVVVYYGKAPCVVEVHEYCMCVRGDAADHASSEETASLLRHDDREVVLLEARSYEALQQTHSSYFRGLDELSRNTASLVGVEQEYLDLAS
jgi:putative GTP pyrophosphokinase